MNNTEPPIYAIRAVMKVALKEDADDSIAERVGVSVQTIRSWKKGDVRNPHRNHVLKFCKAYKINHHWVYGDKDASAFLDTKDVSVRESVMRQEAVDREKLAMDLKTVKERLNGQIQKHKDEATRQQKIADDKSQTIAALTQKLKASANKPSADSAEQAKLRKVQEDLTKAQNDLVLAENATKLALNEKAKAERRSQELKAYNKKIQQDTQEALDRYNEMGQTKEIQEKVYLSMCREQVQNLKISWGFISSLHKDQKEHGLPKTGLEEIAVALAPFVELYQEVTAIEVSSEIINTQIEYIQ